MGNLRKDHPDPERTSQRNRPKQLQTHNVPTKDMEILTAQIREEIYYLSIRCRLFYEEEKGSHKRIRGTGEQLYTDQYILNESKTQRKILLSCWLTEKSYDMNPKRWILHCLKIYKIPDEVIKFYEKTMETWRVESIAGGKSLAGIKIQRSIFQGDALSPLLIL